MSSGRPLEPLGRLQLCLLRPRPPPAPSSSPRAGAPSGGGGAQPALRQALEAARRIREALATLKGPTLALLREVPDAELEETLATTLFERQRNGVVMTPAARELLPRARSIAEEMKGFADQALGLSGQSTYRLGVTPTLGPYLLPQVLPSVHQRFEDLRLYVREGVPNQLSNDLKSAVHDCAA